jgi:hypothetical protein
LIPRDKPADQMVGDYGHTEDDYTALESEPLMLLNSVWGLVLVDVGASSIEVSLTTVDGEIEASPERDQILEAAGRAVLEGVGE